jgi:hypothetical protein
MTDVGMAITVARFANNTKLIFLTLVVSQITIFARKPSVTGITFTFFDTCHRVCDFNIEVFNFFG